VEVARARRAPRELQGDSVPTSGFAVDVSRLDQHKRVAVVQGGILVGERLSLTLVLPTILAVARHLGIPGRDFVKSLIEQLRDRKRKGLVA
jgi:hypothetical protein